MTRAVALQLDPVASLNPAGDSSILIGLEAQRRGYELYYYEPHQLRYRADMVEAPLTPLTLHDREDNWYELGKPALRNLAEMDVIWIRQDPPFDMGYITATYLLEQVGSQTLVLNNPTQLRNCPEKLLPLQLAEHTPETLITSEREAVMEFMRIHGKLVMKPLYGFGGHSVYLISEQDPNTNALLESALSQAKEPWVFQAFLPEVKDQEVRIIMVDGEVVASVGRIPQGEDIRSNLRVGGTAKAIELSDKQREVCGKLKPILQEKQLLLAGIDMIGDYLIEVNITSPTTLKQANALYNIRVESQLWDAVERYV